jgi:hypothetical protein
MLGLQVAGLVVSTIILTAVVGYLIEKSSESDKHANREESHRS